MSILDTKIEFLKGVGPKRSALLNKELLDSFKFYSNKLEILRSVLLQYHLGKLKERGFSLVIKNKKLIKSTKQVKINDQIIVELSDGSLSVNVNTINEKK